MFKIISAWVVSVVFFLLVAWFLTWLYSFLGGSIFLIIVLILLLERSVNRVEKQLKGLQARNIELKEKCDNLSWQVHDLKNQLNDKFQQGAEMKKALLATALIGASFGVYANSNCYGTDTMYTCTDNRTGNTHQVTKFGNSTQVNSYNNRTGSRWSQNTQNYGNQSYTTGHDQNGNTWRHNTNQMGNTQYYNGNDSQGNYYNGNCNQYGGCTTNRYGR